MWHPSVLAAEEHAGRSLWLQLRHSSLPVVTLSIIPASVCVSVRVRERDKVCILKHNRSLAVVTSCEGNFLCPKIMLTVSKDGCFGEKSMDLVGGKNAFSLSSAYHLKCYHHSLRQQQYHFSPHPPPHPHVSPDSFPLNPSHPPVLF